MQEKTISTQPSRISVTSPSPRAARRPAQYCSDFHIPIDPKSASVHSVTHALWHVDGPDELPCGDRAVRRSRGVRQLHARPSRLDLSPAALSRLIAKLARSLGVNLLHRSTRHIRLIDAHRRTGRCASTYLVGSNPVRRSSRRQPMRLAVRYGSWRVPSNGRPGRAARGLARGLTRLGKFLHGWKS
ncbi:helix-turn-helix domain-containing protein [Caballeronia cordobensis]|uniref:helix-turn-helix domain-containing protein n=1 Tax=Caballeronia cordobensis TaxID=1353886 RepID=UPI00128FA10C|nr:LysR family transcriptional regulator [Caballeronia cordobensis]